MASQKPKRPSMLTRQRQLRAQQQQVKNASKNQLPASGGTSGNSRQARAQRANTTRAQAANNQRVITRGMEGFIRRGQANDKADKAARGTGPSGTTRTAGAGGVLGKPTPSAVTTRNRTSSQVTGQPGALARRQGSSPSSSRVEQVRVRDLGSTKPSQVNGSGSRAALPSNRSALPSGRSGGQVARPSAGASAAGNASRGVARGVGRAISRGAGAALMLPALADAAREVIQGTQGNQEWARRSAALRGQSGVRTGTASGRTGRGGTTADRPNVSKPSAAGSPIPASRDLMNSGSTDARFRKPAAARPTPTQSGGGSTPNRGGGGSSSRSMPRAVTRASSGPASDAGMKNQDKNYRGNLFEKTFGYKPGQAPDQTKGSSKQMDTKSDIYTPTTKVDGSQYADKKPDMKKVSEYDRRKRRYYD